MRCQVLFSLLKKDKIKMSSAAVLIGPLRVKTSFSFFLVTENSFASYRKHHPPPVQMVHPQVQKPPPNETVTQNIEADAVEEQILQQETKDEEEKDDNNSHINRFHETNSEDPSDSSNKQNSQEVEINSVNGLSDVADVHNKVGDRQNALQNTTLMPAGDLCETEVVPCSSPTKTAPTSGPVPTISGYVRTVPVVTQYQPVLVRPVQQLNSVPRMTVSAQVIQPVMPVHSNSGTNGLPTPQLMTSAHFNANIMSQSQNLGTSPPFHQVQPIRHTNPINPVNQQTTFGNIQVLIPAGQIFVPVHTPSSALPVMQHLGNNPPRMVNTKAIRRPSKKLLPKLNEVPSKKRKITPEEVNLQDTTVSVSEDLHVSKHLQETFHNTSAVATTPGADKTLSEKCEVTCEKSGSSVHEMDNKRESDDTLSDGSEAVKKEDSSDELLEEDEELKIEMEEYRKLKEERKKKEKEEMEMKKKIVEKMKLAKTKKHLTGTKSEIIPQLNSEMSSDLKTENKVDLALKEPDFASNKEQIISRNYSLASDNQKKHENNKELLANETESLEVIAEWNVPTSTVTPVATCETEEKLPGNKKCDYLNEEKNSCSSAKHVMLAFESSESKVTGIGLDLRVEQQPLSLRTVASEKFSSTLNSSTYISSEVSAAKSAANTFVETIVNTTVSPRICVAESKNLIIDAVKCGQNTIYANTSSAITSAEIGENKSITSDWNIKKSREQVVNAKPFTTEIISSNVSNCIPAAPRCSNAESECYSNDTLIRQSKILPANEIEQRPYSPPILTPRTITFQLSRPSDFEDIMDFEENITHEGKTNISAIESEMEQKNDDASFEECALDLKKETIDDNLKTSESGSKVNGELSKSANTPSSGMSTDIKCDAKCEIKTFTELCHNSIVSAICNTSSDLPDDNTEIDLTLKSYSLTPVESLPKPQNSVSLSVDSSVITSKENDFVCTTSSSTSGCAMPSGGMDIVSSNSSSAYVSEIPSNVSHVICAVSSSLDVPVLSSRVNNSVSVERSSSVDNVMTSTSDTNVKQSLTTSYPMPDVNSSGVNCVPVTAANSGSEISSNSNSVSQVIDLTTKLRDLSTSVIDYSFKTLVPVCSGDINKDKLPDSLPHYISQNVTKRPCQDDSSSHIYVSTSTAPVSVAYSGYTKFTSALQRRLSCDQGKGGIFYEIPIAHIKPKLEKISKGSKPPPAHNDNQIISMKALIKKMNRAYCSVPSQIQQSCPHFRKSLQYNWSPSPKDTFRAKMARRETPIPPPAHIQKPFSIAGKLIVPAGRFIRKRTRSGEFRGLPYGMAKAPCTPPTDYRSSQRIQQSPSIAQTCVPVCHQKTENNSPVQAILPPIRAHIHLDGTADTVTITNVQKPSAFLEDPKPLVTHLNCEKPHVVDLTCDDVLSEQDKGVFQRDLQTDDAEKQIQQELNNAVAKRQKLDSSSDEQVTVPSDFGEARPNADGEPKDVTSNLESDDEIVKKRVYKKRARPQVTGFQVNHPVLPSGIYYRPMHYGPPNVVPSYNPGQQDQHQRPNSGDAEPAQVQMHMSNQRQTQAENRVPPLLRLRGSRRPQPYVYPNQQQLPNR